jgi:hypothetical protein
MEKVGNQLLLRPAAVGTVWDALTGGTQLTDLTDLTGTPVTDVTADSDGAVSFFGPDAVTTVYVDFGYGRRYALAAVDTGAVLTGFMAQGGQPDGWATLDGTGKVPSSQLPSTGGGGGGSGAVYYLLVASSDAPADVKAGAHYVCDGTGDQAEINAAIAAAQTEGGGIVQLSVGSFYLASPVVINGTVDEDNPQTVTLAGCGEHVTMLRPATNTNGIAIGDWAQFHLEKIGIVISGSGSGIVSTSVTSGDTLSFWDSSMRNIRINGGFTQTNTGWGMNLAMPWRSVFENIEVEGTRNGIKLVNDSAVQNAGDCTWNRLFVEIVGTGGVALHIESIDGNMNQNDWFMFEAGANHAGCTGILIDGAAGGASQRFYGTNLEQFQTLINVANGESNVFDLNYVTCDTGGSGNKAFVCGSNSYNNTFSAKWVNIAAGDTLQIIEDNNTTSNAPNIFERIRIENNTGGTVTFTKASSTVLRDITTFNTGNTLPAGLLQYPLTTVNNPSFRPDDHGLIAWTQDPATLGAGDDTTTAGVLYLCKVKIVNRSTVVTNVHVTVSTQGTGLTAAQNLVGLYNSSGTLLSGSADQTTAFGSAGFKTIALTAPQTLAVGSYYVGILTNGTTPPKFLRGTSFSASGLNANLATSAARFLTSGTAQTALPASVTLGSASTNGVARWAALS